MKNPKILRFPQMPSYPMETKYTFSSIPQFVLTVPWWKARNSNTKIHVNENG